MKSRDLNILAVMFLCFYSNQIFSQVTNTQSASEPFTDTNQNGIWDDEELYTDSNKNGNYDAGEPFTDTNQNGIWDQEEPYTDINGNNTWDTSEPFIDINKNGLCDVEESFTDVGNGIFDKGEKFIDINGNNIRDLELWYVDQNRNGKWDAGEHFDDLNNNGKKDYKEPYTDQNDNKKFDIPEKIGDSKFHYNAIKFSEPFTDSRNGRYDLGEEYEDLNGDGKWTSAEEYEDLNGDGKWTSAEEYEDLNGDFRYRQLPPPERPERRNPKDEKYYNVFITSKPSSALVKIDNKSLGVTPIKTHLKAGRYILTIKKNNYVEEEDILFVSKIDKAGNTKHFVLKKKEVKTLLEGSKKKYLLGAGISFGLPALLNYNVRYMTQGVNLEYASNIRSNTSDNSNEPSGNIVGQQYTIGLVGSQNISLNYIWGNTEYVGINAYPALYLVNNNIYEYMGVTIKGYRKYYFWEIGANWGDEQFYGGSPQFYFQFGTMINYKF